MMFPATFYVTNSMFGKRKLSKAMAVVRKPIIFYNNSAITWLTMTFNYSSSVWFSLHHNSSPNKLSPIRMRLDTDDPS